MQRSVRQTYEEYESSKQKTDDLKSLVKTVQNCLLTFGAHIDELSENDTELVSVEQNQHQDNNVETTLVQAHDRIVQITSCFQDVFGPVKRSVTQVRDHCM